MKNPIQKMHTNIVNLVYSSIKYLILLNKEFKVQNYIHKVRSQDQKVDIHCGMWKNLMIRLVEK